MTISDQPSITCPACHRTSYHPKDIEEGYCGACHDWTSDPNDLRRAIRDELANLWGDLHHAMREAIDGNWSIRCDGLQDRITTLTKLVGPTQWQRIQIPLLEQGTYQRIHKEIGVDAPVDMAKVAETRLRIDDQHRTRERGY